MTTVKIVSNPYKRAISFELLNPNKNEWEPINGESNPNSALIKNDIVTQFFPYKAREIVDIIKKEYALPGEHIKLIFEGTNDEYNELFEICKDDDCLCVEQSEKHIENARDILPDIVSVFSMIQPIVDENITEDDKREEIEHNISKFTEASNDIVPICVFGNYSSGKSTFINSLIGLEILPSGDMPVTAKIYKISQLYDSNEAHIRFKFSNYDFNITVTEGECSINSEDKVLTESISDALNEIKDAPLAEKVNRCLEIINDQGTTASDLIEIEVPFAKGVLKDTKSSFVIFDTPGSNSATFKNHLSILEDAMKDLSNGLPIYVAEFNSLDTCDNEKLFNIIKEISQIDDRFTMIVVNKADSANIKEKSFDEQKEQSILEQSIPQHLYSGGIYFVSSIMGLGSKNAGAFIDEHAEEFFEGNNLKYSDPESKWYKELYKYNIMPEQIKKHIVGESEKSENAIYANSGLLAVEHEIINFSEKYSAYDKCNQSDKYITKIIKTTEDEIKTVQEYKEKKRDELDQELQKDKKELIDTIEQTSKNMYQEFVDSYVAEMSGPLEAVEFVLEDPILRELEKNIMHQKQDEHDYSDRIEDVKNAGAAVLDSLKDFGKKDLGTYFKNVGDDIKDAIDNAKELRNAKIDADIDTVNEIVKVVSNDFNERSADAVNSIDGASRQYWENKTGDVKQALLTIIRESKTLEKDKKDELSNIIITYDDIDFTDEFIFKRTELEKKVQLLGWVINLNKIDRIKLANTYNEHYLNAVNNAYRSYKEDHRRSFEKWRKLLVTKLSNNIVDYSPKLLGLAKQIEHETQIIEDLIETKATLQSYSEEIESLMDWKEL